MARAITCAALLQAACSAGAAAWASPAGTPPRGEIHLPLLRHHGLSQGLGLEVLVEGAAPRKGGGLPLKMYSRFSPKFYVEVTLGTPPHVFRLSPDTGSAYLAVPSASCSQCSPSPDVYDEASSVTFSPVPCNRSQCQGCFEGRCGLQVRYVDGSGFDAQLVTDLFQGAANVTFGAITREVASGDIAFQPPTVDGIWGLAYRSMAHGLPTIFDQLVASGVVQKDVFAVSMSPLGTAGMLYLGGDGKQSHRGPVEYTPITNETYYVVELEAVLVNGKPLNVPSADYNKYETIVDSGSTDIIIPPAAHAELKRALLENCQRVPLVGVCAGLYGDNVNMSLFEGHCYAMTAEEVDAFPAVSFQLPRVGGGSFTLDVPPSLYLQRDRCTIAGGVALAIDRPIVEHGSTVLGDAFMSAYVVIHDREGGRLGFAPSSTLLRKEEAQREGLLARGRTRTRAPLADVVGPAPVLPLAIACVLVPVSLALAARVWKRPAPLLASGYAPLEGEPTREGAPRQSPGGRGFLYVQ